MNYLYLFNILFLAIRYIGLFPSFVSDVIIMQYFVISLTLDKDHHLITHSLDLETSHRKTEHFPTHACTRAGTFTQDELQIKGSFSGNLPWM